MPAVNGANRARGESLDWAHANSQRFIGAMIGGIARAVADHEAERGERGQGTAWRPGPK